MCIYMVFSSQLQSFITILFSGFRGVKLIRKTGLTDWRTGRNIIPSATRCVGYKSSLEPLAKSTKFDTKHSVTEVYGFFCLFVCYLYPVKDCKFLPMLGTHGHVPHLLWHAYGHPLILVISRTVTLTPIAER